MTTKSGFFLFPAALALLFLLGSCFKDEPKRPMRMAAGTWRIETVTIQQNDSLGSELSTATIDFPGMLLLSHDDEFEYQGSYSYSYDGAALSASEMHAKFAYCDVWGMSVEGKTFNLGNLDPSTGYVAHVAGFTVLKQKHKKIELQYVRLHPVTGRIHYQETWKLTRGTH